MQTIGEVDKAEQRPVRLVTGFAKKLKNTPPGGVFEIKTGRTGAYVTAKRMGIEISVRQIKGKPGWIKVWRLNPRQYRRKN
jgi:hypothetical protein